MQTSSIMIDSTLGKILTADEVDKSVQSKNADETTSTTNSNEEQTTTISSEAEVRLVFRFTVEEHIVYKGKIERVQQLQTEELSRLVSKIAWDGAKEEEDKRNKVMLQSDNMIDSKHSDVDSKKSGKCHQKSLSTQTIETSFSSKVQEGNLSPTELDCQQVTTKEKTTTCNNQLSDHEAYVHLKSPNLKRNSKDSSLAQFIEPQIQNSTTCDKSKSEHFLNHIRLTDQEQSSEKHQQIDLDIKQHERENNILEKMLKTIDNDDSLKTIVFKSDEETEQNQQRLNEHTIDSQLIADTIKECVNSVDLEFSAQRAAEVSPKDIITSELTNDKEMSESIEHYPTHDEQMIEITLEHNVPNDSSKGANDELDVNIISQIHSTDVDIVSNCLETKKKLSNISEQKSFNDTGTDRNEEFMKKTKHVTQHYKKDSTTSSTTTITGKRKSSSDHNSSSKKIRKSTSSKDQRNLLTRKSTSKAIGNISSDQNNSISPPMTNNNNNSSNYYHIQSNSSEKQQQQPQQPQQQQQQIRHTNKIFAKWTDNHYYPGTILRQAKDRKFVIGFLDGAQRNVAQIDLIPLCNIEGRQVRVSIAKNYCVNALVHHQSYAINDQPMFDVEYQQEGIVRKSVPFKDIFLTGDQGSLLINQVDRNSGASNFADVDLDNIIYEKRSRRFQDMEDYELTENTSLTGKRKRGQYSMRNSRAKTSVSPDSPAPVQTKRNSQCENNNHDSESTGSPDVLKTNFLCPNSNPPSESSSSTGSSNVPNVLELGQEFYFASSSPHRTKTSLLL